MSGSRADRRGAVLAAGLLSLSVLGAPSARAADDGYASVFSSVLGSVGLIKGDPAPDIDYRERPPLVVPRDAALPKPAAGAAKRPAAWPQDPDVLRHRKELDEARAPNTIGQDLRDRGVLMSNEDMNRGRAAENGPVRPNACGNNGNQRNCLIVSPDELKAENDRYKSENPENDDTVVAGQEPERAFLTQPPKGYLKPTKTVKATAEAPVEKLNEGSARYMQRMEARKKAEEE